MKKTGIKKLLLLALLPLCACTEEIEQVNQGAQGIVMTAKDFVSEKDVRTSIEVSESNGALFTWAENDTVGIFPNEGTQVAFPMTNGAGSKQAIFTGGGWALKSSSYYSAYYPYYILNKDIRKVRVDFNGQTQTGNASTAHLGRYDYMAARAKTPENGSVNFDFEHLGCLVQVDFVFPEQGDITFFSLCSEEKILPGKGVIDLTSYSPIINISEYSDTLEMNVREISTQSGNEKVTVYFMLPPVDLRGKAISFEVGNENNTYHGVLNLGQLIAGKSYKRGIDKLELDEKVEMRTASEFLEIVKSAEGIKFRSSGGYIVKPLNMADILSLKGPFVQVVYQYNKYELSYPIKEVNATIMAAEDIQNVEINNPGKFIENAPVASIMQGAGNNVYFFDKDNIIIPLSFYYMASSDQAILNAEVKSHHFELVQIDSDVNSTDNLIMQLIHHVDDTSINHIRKTVGSMYYHIDLATVLGGKIPAKIIFKFRSSYNASMENADNDLSSISINYKEIYDRYFKQEK